MRCYHKENTQKHLLRGVVAHDRFIEDQENSTKGMQGYIKMVSDGYIRSAEDSLEPVQLPLHSPKCTNLCPVQCLFH